MGYVSYVLLEGRWIVGGEVRSEEGVMGAILGFLVRVGLVEMMWWGAAAAAAVASGLGLVRLRKKLAGRVSESFRGMV